MRAAEQTYTFDRVVRLVISALVVIGLLWLARHLSDVLIPFVAAVIAAYLLNPLVSAVERRTGNRGAAVFLTLGGIGIIGMAITVLLVPLMYFQIARLARNVNALVNDLAQSVQPELHSRDSAANPGESPTKHRPAGQTESRAERDAGSFGPDSEHRSTTRTDVQKGEPGGGAANGRNEVGGGITDGNSETALGWREFKEGLRRYRQAGAAGLSGPERLNLIREAVAGTYLGGVLDALAHYVASEEFQTLVFQTARRVAAGGLSVLSFAVNLALGLTGLVIVLLYLVFLLLDYRDYARNWQGLIPAKYSEPIVEFLTEFEIALRRYFRGQAIVALLTGGLMAVGFTLMGLPLAVPFGLFVGLLNMVPYLQTVALVPAFMLALVRTIEQDTSLFWSVLLVLLVFGVVQLLQDFLIVPKVVGEATGLRPVAILLGVFIWGKLLGFMGVLLAIPLTCLGIAYYRRYVLKQQVRVDAG